MSIQRVISLMVPLIMLWLIIFVRIGTAEEDRTKAPTVRQQPLTLKDPSLPEKPAGQRSIITVKNGRLSVQVQNRPLEWVLEAISREGRVAIIKAEGVGSEQVSVQFQDLPLDEGLRRILKDHDVFFSTASKKRSLPP